VGVIGGWIAGVYAYFGALWLIEGSIEPGGIHIGALLLGILGSSALGFGAWRWSARFSDQDD
jgi:hypothetical protein